jgi:hypothetical protein
MELQQMNANDLTSVVAALETAKTKRNDAIAKANADYEAVLSAAKGKLSDIKALLDSVGLLTGGTKTAKTRQTSASGNINKAIAQKKRALSEAKERGYTQEKVAQLKSDMTQLEKRKLELAK